MNVLRRMCDPRTHVLPRSMLTPRIPADGGRLAQRLIPSYILSKEIAIVEGSRPMHVQRLCKVVGQKRKRRHQFTFEEIHP